MTYDVERDEAGVGGDLLEAVVREPQRAEQQPERIEPRGVELGVVPGLVVLVEEVGDARLGLGLCRRVGAIGQLVGVAELVPVLAPERRVVAVGPQPHVDRRRRVRLERHVLVGPGRVVEVVADDLVFRRLAPDLAERTPGAQLAVFVAHRSTSSYCHVICSLPVWIRPLKAAMFASSWRISNGRPRRRSIDARVTTKRPTVSTRT